MWLIYGSFVALEYCGAQIAQESAYWYEHDLAFDLNSRPSGCSFNQEQPAVEGHNDGFTSIWVIEFCLKGALGKNPEKVVEVLER